VQSSLPPIKIREFQAQLKSKTHGHSVVHGATVFESKRISGFECSSADMEKLDLPRADQIFKQSTDIQTSFLKSFGGNSCFRTEFTVSYIARYSVIK
jgi:hypothetical protein